VSEVVHGKTSQIVQAMLQAGQILFCWESKTAAPAKPNPLKDGDGKPRVSSNFLRPLLKGLCSFSLGFKGQNGHTENHTEIREGTAGDLKGGGTIILAPTIRFCIEMSSSLDP
jgi:hypothetical protein